MRLEPFKLERYFAPTEFAARYMLSGSDCESLSIGQLLAMVPGAREEFEQQWLGYTETAGDAGLRAAITGLYETVDADDVLLHAGASEVIFNFMNSALSSDDRVVVHYPCYQSLHQVAEGIGCEVVRWTTSAANEWRLDLEFLRDTMGARTRAIVVNSPHNPTGYHMSRQVMDEIIELARAKGILLFSDEVYRGLEHDPGDLLPAACDLYENAVSVGVMSKSYGLPGLRIGWAATRNRQLLDAMQIFKDYTTLCNSAPSEFLARTALSVGPRILERNRSIVLDNLELLRAFFLAHAERLSWVEPRAGATGFPTLSGGTNVESFCRALFEREGVLLLPGTVYDASSREFRIGFGRRDMPAALERLDKYLRG